MVSLGQQVETLMRQQIEEMDQRALSLYMRPGGEFLRLHKDGRWRFGSAEDGASNEVKKPETAEADEKPGLVGVEVTALSMSAPKTIELPTPEELGCQDVGVTLPSEIGAFCEMGEGVSDEVLSNGASNDVEKSATTEAAEDKS